MPPSTAALEIRNRVRALLASHIKWRQRLQIYFVVLGVLAAGASEAFSNVVPDSVKPFLIAGWFFGLLLAFLGGVIFAFVDDGEPGSLLRAQEAVDTVAQQRMLLSDLEVDFRWMARLYITNNVFREMVEHVTLQGGGSLDDQQRRLEAMLDVLVADKTLLFGINDDRWNFAVYFYDAAQGLLICRACRRPTRAEEEASHRSWAPGEGHIGLAFQTARTIVAGDTSEPTAHALFDAPDAKKRTDDRERYRSIASLPIRMQDERPIGVLVATSDVPHRFTLRQSDSDTARDSVEPLRSLASALAMLDKANHLHAQPR